MAVKVNQTIVINDNKRGVYQKLNPGAYSASELPSDPQIGDMVFNTTTSELQFWTGTRWKS